MCCWMRTATRSLSPMLDRSSRRSIGVSVDVYPDDAKFPSPTDRGRMWSRASRRRAMWLEASAFSRKTLTVAADQELLEGVEELHDRTRSPMEGASQSFSATRGSCGLRCRAFKSISADEVYVNDRD